MPIINQVVKGGGSPAPAPTGLYREFQLEGGTLVPNKTTTHIMDFTGMTEIYDCLLFMTYAGNTAISGVVDMSDLITIYGDMVCGAMFQGCTGITSANLSALTTISGQGSCDSMFSECTGLTSFDLSALTTISGDGACGGMFQYCTGIISANLPALTDINGSGACSYMFYRCTGITSANLSALTTISGDDACGCMFQGCTSLATVYIGGTAEIDFGGTEPFNNMFQDCYQDTIDVYAPAANQATIEAFSGYPNFGGTGTVTWHWRS